MTAPGNAFRTFAAAAALILMGCAAQVVRGPESCSIARNETDAFGGTRRTRVFHFDSGSHAVGLVEERGGVRMWLVLTVRALSHASVAEGTAVRMALADRTVLELTTRRDATPVSNAGPNVPVHTRWVVNAPLTPEQVEALARSPVVEIRTRAGSTRLGKRVPSGVQAQLQTLAICFSAHSAR